MVVAQGDVKYLVERPIWKSFRFCQRNADTAIKITPEGVIQKRLSVNANPCKTEGVKPEKSTPRVK